MTEQHQITPPPKLVEEWQISLDCPDGCNAKANYIAAKAARWGADQELEACCDHIRNFQWGFVDRPDGTKMHRAVDLQLARRPKPPSLKEQALSLIPEPGGIAMKRTYSPDQLDIIRRALEQLDD